MGVRREGKKRGEGERRFEGGGEGGRTLKRRVDCRIITIKINHHLIHHILSILSKLQNYISELSCTGKNQIVFSDCFHGVLPLLLVSVSVDASKNSLVFLVLQEKFEHSDSKYKQTNIERYF